MEWRGVSTNLTQFRFFFFWIKVAVESALMNEPAFRQMEESVTIRKDVAVENMSIDDGGIVIVDSTDPNDEVRDAEAVLEEIERINGDDVVEEVQEINFDENASAYGNWTLEVCKTRLNNYLNANKINAQYNYTYTQKNDKRYVFLQINFFLNS